MGFLGPQISKANGGLGRTEAPGDNILCLVMGGVAVDGGAQLDTPIRLLSTTDAEDAGLNAAYDAANNVLVYYHIKEFFRLAPNAELWIMLVAQDTTQTEIVTKETGALQALVLSDEAAGKIKYGGVVLNPATDYDPTINDGIDADVLTAIPKAQELVDFMLTEQMFFDGIVLEGRSFDETADYADLRTLNAGSVQVCIGQDPDVAALHAIHAEHACVGALLGMIAARQVNENVGSVDIKNKPLSKKGNPSYPLGDGIVWLSAALSSGTKFSNLSQARKTDLTNKGYVYAGSYRGYSGIFFNSSPTCTSASSDYAFGENNRVWNKAARIVRATLIPKMKGTLKTNPATGFIKSSSASGLEAIINNALKVQMVDLDECSAAAAYINPQQQVDDTHPLQVNVKVVLDKIIHEMTVEIALTNQL
ncbi:MAG: DUF2586 family protein [Chitinophagales bacterium]